MTHLAASLLETQPGTVIRYGPATIDLGRVIEVITGKTLDVAWYEHIFLALGMTDTFFIASESKRSRIVSPCALKPGQGLARSPLDSTAPRLLSAGGNLFGTAGETCVSARCC